MSTQTLFVLSNILGGLAVLGGYYWGITSFSEYREALWGGVTLSTYGYLSAKDALDYTARRLKILFRGNPPVGEYKY